MIPKKKTVVIVEDDLLLQQHLIEIIKVAEDIACLGAVSSAEEAEQKIPSLQPDVVLMDINLPGKSGIDCIRGLKKRLPNLEVVMLTAYEEEDNIFRALKEGASGYIIKSSNSNDILEAIRDVFAGESPFSGPIARKMAMYFREERESSLRLQVEGRWLGPPSGSTREPWVGQRFDPDSGRGNRLPSA